MATITLVGEFLGKIEKCDNLLTYSGIDSTADFFLNFGSTINYYLGFDADLKLFSDGSQSLTINGHTVSFVPSATIFTEFHLSAADAAANDGIPWIAFIERGPNIFGASQEVQLISGFTPGVPEPATWALMLVGLGIFAGWRKVRGRAWLGAARRALARRGQARQGLARHGRAWRG